MVFLTQTAFTKTGDVAGARDCPAPPVAKFRGIEMHETGGTTAGRTQTGQTAHKFEVRMFELQRIKSALKQNPVIRSGQRQYEKLGRIGRQVTGSDSRAIADYLAQHATRKLHLGCGFHRIDGWLNSDLTPRSKAVVMVDVTKKFPFADETFDYVFSEHMIEHLSYAQGRQMLDECFRVLRPGGTLRLSTPDLSFLIDLYGKEKSMLQDCYIRWVTEKFIDGAPACEDTFVINNFVRNWGHTFIYDEKTLRSSLEKSQFTGIVRCNLNESLHQDLRNLENERRLPDGFVRLETFTLEATATE